MNRSERKQLSTAVAGKDWGKVHSLLAASERAAGAAKEARQKKKFARLAEQFPGLGIIRMGQYWAGCAPSGRE